MYPKNIDRTYFPNAIFVRGGTIDVHEYRSESIAATRIRIKIIILITPRLEIIVRRIIKLLLQIPHHLQSIDLPRIFHDPRKIKTPCYHLPRRRTLTVPRILTCLLFIRRRPQPSCTPIQTLYLNRVLNKLLTLILTKNI